MESQPHMPGNPATDPLAGLARRNLWVAGLAVDDDGGIVGPGLRRYSFWADCECPDDCLRDHENE